MTRYSYRPDLRDECADREEQDPFDNSDEEMEDRREQEEEDRVITDRNELARLIRKEFDATSRGLEGHDARIQWIRIAKNLDFYVLAEEMTNDLKVGSI
jgi:hypothetical protein